MFVLGVDIGYSNLKLAIGQSGSEPKTIILPAGAGPADRSPTAAGPLRCGATGAHRRAGPPCRVHGNAPRLPV